MLMIKTRWGGQTPYLEKKREEEESYRTLRTKGSANTSTRPGSPHDGAKRRFQRLAKALSSEESLST